MPPPVDHGRRRGQGGCSRSALSGTRSVRHSGTRESSGGGSFMIEQAYVQAGDQTTPTIQDIRARISQAVDATAGPVLDRLKCWLQMPTDSMFTGMMDSDCQGRAQRVGALLSPGAEG